jgi:riboflavin transporter FmnP
MRVIPSPPVFARGLCVQKERFTMENNRDMAHRIARVGVLGALSAILYYIPGIPIIPPMYKLDFSTLPALLGGFSLGPWHGLLIVLIKDLTGLFHSSSVGVGELADFLMSGAFVLPAAFIYRQRHSRGGAVGGMALGLIAMTIVGALTNYFFLLPFYINVMGMTTESIIKSVSASVPYAHIDSLPKMIAFGTAPFNALKGLVLSLVTLLIYKRLSPLLHTPK